MTVADRRRGFLGGTDIAAIIGVSPWRSPLDVWLDKTGRAEQRETNYAMRRGTRLEALLLDEFGRRHPEYRVSRPRKPVVRDNAGFPAGASLDGLAYPKASRKAAAVLEAKTAFGSWKAFRGRDLPDQYWVQVQWYLWVTGLPVAYVIADTGAWDVKEITIEPDGEVQQRLVDEGRRFWVDYVMADTPPPPAPGHPSDLQALGVAYRETTDDVLELPDDVTRLVAAYVDEQRAKAEHEARLDELKATIAAAMGPHTKARGGSYEISWAPQTRMSVDTKALKAAHPDIAEQFTRTTESRVLRIRTGGGGHDERDANG